MTTSPISLLPPELLYQILAEVAWIPPHLSLQLRYNRLLTTSRVHSSWRHPSQHLLSRQISFFNLIACSPAEKFLSSAGVPEEWAAEELELGGIGRSETVKAVVARASRIECLRFHALFAGGIPADLFDLPALEGELGDEAHRFNHHLCTPPQKPR